MTPVDIAVVVLYLSLVSGLGLYFARRQRSTEDYFLAGRSVPGWIVGFSLMATVVSSATFVGHSGNVFQSDMWHLPLFFSLPLVMFLVGRYLVVFYRHHLRMSVYEYLGQRFGYPAQPVARHPLQVVARHPLQCDKVRRISEGRFCMPWKRVDVMEERVRFVARALAPDRNMSELCRQFGISRPTGYQWVGRYQEGGSFAKLSEHSRRPHRSPRQTPEAVEERVVELRRRYGWGARKLAVLLEREGIRVQEWTVHRILRRQGYVQKEDSRRPALKRFEREAPNELWQMDFKGEYQYAGGWCYPLSIVDDHSRYAVGLYPLRSPALEPVRACVVRTFEVYGVPEALLMDHGTPWWSTTNGYGLTRLSVELIEQGIRLCFSGVGHPQTQGKVEQFHCALSRAVRHRGRPQGWVQWKALLAAFREEYNQVRPHEALAMAVPATRYQPSRKAYTARPREWEYPPGCLVKRLNSQGCLYWRARCYFVCEALAGQRVAVEPVDQKLLVRYRHMYIREIDLLSHQTRAVVYPSKKRSESKHRPDGKVETDPQKRSLPTFPPARLRPETDDEV